MVQLIDFFQVSLLISVRNMFLSKAFSMSQMDIYQISRLNYYKTLKQMTLMEIILVLFCLETCLLKRWRRRFFRKEEYCQIYQQCFYLEELSQIQWSISKKQNKGRAYETTIGI